MMHRPFVFVFAAAMLAGAQEKPNLFNAAPPEVDKALRERVSGFYQAYVDGKFRNAEPFVAEDTKDLHYNQEKTKIRGFEIIKINYDDSFKKASVVTLIQTTLQMRGQVIPANAPMATHWKLENGKWCYYYDPALGRETPMGRITPGPGNKEGMKIEDMMKDPNIILNQIKINKEKFLVNSWEKSADTIVVTNGMPGSVTLSFQTESIPGLTYRVERTELVAGQSSQIEIVYDPKDPSAKPTLKATLRIEPTGKTLIIPIVFDIPEELKKQLPKQQ
ncbi:MAG: hypothetical protein HYX27_20545 [Acidobacteria bacterium]|nr:hypothetical protein [Acidobacteriota bacterium]